MEHHRKALTEAFSGYNMIDALRKNIAAYDTYPQLMLSNTSEQIFYTTMEIMLLECELAEELERRLKESKTRLSGSVVS